MILGKQDMVIERFGKNSVGICLELHVVRVNYDTIELINSL